MLDHHAVSRGQTGRSGPDLAAPACRLWKLPEILRSLHQLRQLSISAESTLETLPDWLHELHSLEEFSFECPIQCG